MVDPNKNFFFSFLTLTERFPNVAAHEIENAIFEETKSVFRNNVLYSSQRYIIILQFYSLRGLFLDTFNSQRRMVLETKLTAKGMFPSTPLKINQGKLDL